MDQPFPLLGAALRLPHDHPQRVELNDEVHARPPEHLTGPVRISYLAMLTEGVARDAPWQAVADLAARFGVPPPEPGANHWTADFGLFRLKWELHTEFHRCMFVASGVGADDPFEEPAIDRVPADWVAALPGALFVAAHVALVRAVDYPFTHEAITARLFQETVPVGAAVAGGVATALTDFRIRPDGFSRFFVVDRGMSPWQAGRIVQRLLEIDTYRIMALMALPVARTVAPQLTRQEAELAGVTAALIGAKEEDEPRLLEQLTRLAAAIENAASANLYRFSAASAYWGLVRRRIADLREARIEGLQPFQEFTERRLAPAMDTCEAIASRQDALSRRVARATQLLSTRVELTRERQTQEVLREMNKRADLQLRLQQTVETISVAAISYYVIGLLGYVVKGATDAGAPVDPDIATGALVPVVAVLIFLFVRSVRRRLEKRGAPSID